MAKPAQRERTFAVEDASLGDVSRALAEGKVTASDLARAYLARIEAYDRGGCQDRASIPCARSIPTRCRLPPPRWRKTVGAPAAGRGADPGQGQHRHRRQAAHDRGFPRAGECARPGRRHGRQAAARGGGSDPGQGEPHGVRQHPHRRHALGLQLAGRPGEEPVRAIAGRRARHPRRAAGRVELGSAVAVAAGLCAAAIGTETSGSLLSPATQNGLVTVKPTVGLDQPRRHPADLAQPGHGRPADAHRARCGDPAERAGGARSARSRDAAAAAAEGLHRRPRQGRPEGRAHRCAERSRRSAERHLPGQAAAAVPRR